MCYILTLLIIFALIHIITTLTKKYNKLIGVSKVDENTLSGALSCGVGSLYGYIVGLNYKLLFTLMIIMSLDIIIGVIFAFYNGTFRSSNMKKGLLYKMALLLLLLAIVFFQIVLDEYGIKAPFSNMMAGILTFMEMFSIMETFADNGIILPKFIVDWFDTKKEELLKGNIEKEDK